MVTRYIGKDEIAIADIKEKLTRRKQVEEILKKLVAEKTQIEKMETIL